MRVRAAAVRGVTLVELLVVLMILSLILTAAIRTWDVALQRGRFEQTRQKLDRLATAIVGNPDYIVAGQRADFGYVGDMGSLPVSLADLAVSPPVSPPESSKWQGPYIRAAFAQSPDAYRIDAWGDSIFYGVSHNPESMFVRSYGGVGLVDPTRWITRSLGVSQRAALRNEVSGLVLDQRGSPPASDSVRLRLAVSLEYPRNGRTVRDSTQPSADGSFRFLDIPQGIRLLRATYWSQIVPYPVCETVSRSIVVMPGSGARGLEVRMNVDW
uniref:Prepilin-type N-terminal cleavage/methylation domain-containing protein n=1 Tax=candidate division WOR-3 bacterium TaxID=2052148 RepID=A0A7C4GGM4_UNCW3